MPFVQRGGQLRNRGDMTPTKGTMQASVQSNQHRLLAPKVIDCYLALASDRIEHDVRRSLPQLQRPMMVRHALASLVLRTEACDASSRARVWHQRQGPLKAVGTRAS